MSDINEKSADMARAVLTAIRDMGHEEAEATLASALALLSAGCVFAEREACATIAERHYAHVVAIYIRARGK